MGLDNRAQFLCSWLRGLGMEKWNHSYRLVDDCIYNCSIESTKSRCAVGKAYMCGIKGASFKGGQYMVPRLYRGCQAMSRSTPPQIHLNSYSESGQPLTITFAFRTFSHLCSKTSRSHMCEGPFSDPHESVAQLLTAFHPLHRTNPSIYSLP